MSIKMTKHGKGIREQVLSKFEASIGHKIPSDYREFLMKYNGGIPETNEFSIPQINTGSGINEFLSIELTITLSRTFPLNDE